jgi:hypothetical protein
MIFNDRNILLSISDLVNSGLSEHYLIKRALPANRSGHLSSYSHIPDPKDARRKLVYYHSLPERVKEMVKTNLCAGMEPFDYVRMQEQMTKEAAQQGKFTWLENLVDAALDERYTRHLSGLLQVEDPSRRVQLAKVAAIMELAIEVRMRTTHGPERASLKDLFEILQARQIPFIKLTNYASFTRRVQKAEDSGLFSVAKIAREGNQNRLTMGSFQQHIALAYYGHPKAYTIPQVYELMKYTCEQYGQKAPAEGTVKNFLALKKNQLLVSPSRNGEKHYRDTVKPYILRTPALYPSDLWVMDGTRLNLLARRNGKPVMYDVFFVMDAHTGIVLGFDIALNEDRWMVFKSLKMAVEITGHLPGELLSDNSSAIKSQEITALTTQMEGLGVKIRNAKVGNARDKVIERLIDTLQTTGMKWHDNYVGAGITAQKRNNNRPSPEWVAANASDAPELSDLIIQFTQIVAIHNLSIQNGKARLDRFNEMERPNAVTCNHLQQVSMFWLSRKITVRQALVRITIRGEERAYRVWKSEDWMEVEGRQVMVKYDEAKPELIYLFNLEGAFICEASEAERPHYAHVNQTDADKDQFIKQTSHFEKMDRDRAKVLADLEEKALEDAGLEELDLNVTVQMLRKDDLNRAETKALMRYVEDRFDIDSKSPAGPAPEQLSDMYFDSEEEIKPVQIKKIDEED